jgi:ubiquinone/menaquinone biosynthesis C-methylase UbiE
MPSVSFDRVADRYDETRGGLDRGRWLAGEIAPHLTTGAVLEVGVGTGAIALPLTELGHDVVGVDLSGPMLAQARRRLGPVLAMADGFHLPVPDGGVANVVIVWVLQLVGDSAGFLREARRVLVDDGVLIVVVSGQPPEDDELDAILRPMHETLRPPTDRPPQIVAAAKLAGLQLVTSAPTSRTWRTSPEEQARLVEQRAFSSLWDVPADLWRAVGEPAVAALRALPEPDRPRSRRSYQEVLVFTAIPSAS